MIPTLQLDPSSLALWITGDLICQFPGANLEDMNELVRLALLGNATGMRELVEKEANSSVRLYYSWISSCFWHEKRHFLDLCFSNYGANRFRSFFHVAVNKDIALAEFCGKGAFYAPFDIYSQPVCLEAHGIPEPNASVLPFAQEIARRKAESVADNATIDTPAGTIRVGGQWQLEAMAFISQMACINENFGTEYQESIRRAYVKTQSDTLIYRWMEVLSLSFENAFSEIAQQHENKLVLFNHSLAWCLLQVSLCGRFFREPTAAAVRSSRLPRERFNLLIHRLPKKAWTANLTAPEAWRLVNATAKEAWGKDALEEVESDLAQEAALIQRLRRSAWFAPRSVMDAYQDYHELRCRIFEYVRTDPGELLSPEHFASHLADRLFPIPVFAIPSSLRKAALPENAKIIVGMSAAADAAAAVDAAVWAWTPTTWTVPGGTGFGLRQVDAWHEVISLHAPLVKIMTFGRRHGFMLIPEIFGAERFLEESGIDLAYDPDFEHPIEDYDVNAFCAATGRSDLICDLTGARLRPEDAIVVPPWALRQHPKLTAIKQKLGPEADRILALDWSLWVLHRDWTP